MLHQVCSIGCVGDSKRLQCQVIASQELQTGQMAFNHRVHERRLPNRSEPKCTVRSVPALSLIYNSHIRHINFMTRHVIAPGSPVSSPVASIVKSVCTSDAEPHQIGIAIQHMQCDIPTALALAAAPRALPLIKSPAAPSAPASAATCTDCSRPQVAPPRRSGLQT